MTHQRIIRVRIMYGIALGIIAATILSSFALIRLTLEANVGDSRIINLAGRQRMLSQRMTKCVLILERPSSAAQGQARRDELAKAFADWTKAHVGLQQGDPELGLPARSNSAAIRALFEKIQPSWQAMATAFAGILAGQSGSAPTDMGPAVDTILANETTFLPLMDAITFQFDAEAKEKVAAVQALEGVVLGIGLLVLLCEFLLVFQPTTRQLSAALTGLEREAEESARLRVQADAANRAKSQFLANMSHEIRTPMNAILGFSGILLATETDPRRREQLEAVTSSGNALLHLINDILDLSKIEAGKLTISPAAFDPRRLADEVRLLFMPRLAEKNLAMETLVDPELPKALIGDSVRLRQILINLVGNAIKFTEEGSVRLELCLAEPADASRVDLEIAVVDTGKGVAESDRDRIFRAFEQAEGQDHSAFGGTGLGLAICRDLIGLMGGRIWVEANQPRGTVFRFFLPGLPVAAAPVAAREAPDAGTWEYRFAPANILLVDDVPLNHKLLRCLLEDQPFRFRQALDGQEALDAIHQGKPDLVLTDLKMPRLGGEDLADKLRADPELAGIPVIAVTASALNADLERLAPKFDAIILKPVSKERLLAELGRFLAHEKSAPAGPAPSPADARLVPAAGELSADLAAELAGLDAEFRGPSQSSPFSVLREFTARLAAIGVERHSETVQAMVAELEGAIGSYDVGRIRQALERFRNLSRNAGGQ